MRTIAAAVAAVITATAAGAQTPLCMPQDEMQVQLAERFAEVVVGAGVTYTGHILELWASDAGTFTATMTNADGITCIATFGDAWTAVNRKPKGIDG